VFDEDWVTGQLAAALTMLLGLDLPRATRYAPAVAISPSPMVSFGRVADLPRTRAGGFGLGDKAVQVLPEESLPADHIERLAGDVAAELTARLAAALRRR
jgi:hypothetical protein